MRRFVEEYAANSSGGVVYDVGSREVSGGSYAPLFADLPQWRYVGLDIEPGANVDIVVSDPYAWRELEANSADLVISGQTFEHIEYPWLAIKEIARILTAGSLACIIVPSKGQIHRHPVDCYRYYPDGLKSLAKWAELDVVSVDMDDSSASTWGDCCCVMRKP
jgi:SAM-dependent methyltransferase